MRVIDVMINYLFLIFVVTIGVCGVCCVSVVSLVCVEGCTYLLRLFE
jgi:hypothetical protein